MPLNTCGSVNTRLTVWFSRVSASRKAANSVEKTSSPLGSPTALSPGCRLPPRPASVAKRAERGTTPARTPECRFSPDLHRLGVEELRHLHQPPRDACLFY